MTSIIKLYSLRARFLKGLTFILLILLSQMLSAQVDTVISNNQKIACSVKEITPDAIKFTYPGEDVLNSVYKNTVQKIIFKSGRVQTFAEATSYKTITGVQDHDKVTITEVESEVQGLFKITDVSSKAKGTTVYSSQEKVKDRAYNKLKIQAAMFGANIIYLTNIRTEGNKYGGYYQSSSTAETNLTGVAYSNILPDYESFKKLIGSNTNFNAIEKFELDASDSDVSFDVVDDPFVVLNISFDGGIVTIEGKLKGENNVDKFQLASLNENTFSIAYRHKGDAYNFTIRVK